MQRLTESRKVILHLYGAEVLLFLNLKKTCASTKVIISLLARKARPQDETWPIYLLFISPKVIKALIGPREQAC